LWIADLLLENIGKMNRRVRANEFVELARTIPVLDVRSPGEYLKGHIPGAISFPLFDNHERAEIGTLYKQVGQAVAIERGMELVQPRIQEMYRQAVSHIKDGKLLVHCWRGGKRSESVAAMIAVSGAEVGVLEGGYKAYRNWTLGRFVESYDIRLIGGATGTGKTAILHRLQEKGSRILDLEGHADHRGSAFGRLAATREVSHAQFENVLAWDLHFSNGAPLWIEDESRTIGNLSININLWKQMQAAKLYYIELPLEVRVSRLIEDYGHFPKEMLLESVQKIGRRLGGLRLREIVSAIQEDRAEDAVRMLLEYYDKAYTHTMRSRAEANIHRISFTDFDADAIADALLELS
jgi:tRNA 2-selenouridine synthase